MATYKTLTVLDAVKAGTELNATVTPLMVGADTQEADGFSFANDGNVVLLVQDDPSTGAGDDILFTGINDPYGRPEADLTRTITLKKMYVYGPFLPLIWNQADGTIKVKFTTHAATTTLIAIRVANPT